MIHSYDSRKWGRRRQSPHSIMNQCNTHPHTDDLHQYIIWQMGSSSRCARSISKIITTKTKPKPEKESLNARRRSQIYIECIYIYKYTMCNVMGRREGSSLGRRDARLRVEYNNYSLLLARVSPSHYTNSFESHNNTVAHTQQQITHSNDAWTCVSGESLISHSGGVTLPSPLIRMMMHLGVWPQQIARR